MRRHSALLSFFFFNDPQTTDIYPLSRHDALPIWQAAPISASWASWSSATTSSAGRATWTP